MSHNWEFKCMSHNWEFKCMSHNWEFVICMERQGIGIFLSMVLQTWPVSTNVDENDEAILSIPYSGS
jgi:hypothetical protein